MDKSAGPPSSQAAPGPRSQPSPSRCSPSTGTSNTRRFEESWVEVASQPSSSSLSSIGDEIVTTRLRVRGPGVRGPDHDHRRRRLQGPARSLLRQQTAVDAVDAVGAGTSSQEEYDESGSGSDDDGRLLASSTEHGGATSPEVVEHVSEAEPETESDSDGDGATALGRAPSHHRPVFSPQPNAFSHPAAHAPPPRSHPATTSSMPPHPHSGFTRPSFSQPSQTARLHRRGPSFMTPASAREDNDAALRASLTTLLSCAAAARGLPKSKDEAAEAQRARSRGGGVGVGPGNQPVELRLVPEAELMRQEDDDARQHHQDSSPARQLRTADSPSASPAARASPPVDKAKRAVSAATRSPRASKKKKLAAAATPPSEDALISPTLLTWVVSAGVVVLVSVVGFGAGYVIGREVGRQEAQHAVSASLHAANETSHTGREVMRSSSGGFRRIRWGAGSLRRGIVAQV